MFPNLIKYIIHKEPSLPPYSAIAYEYIMASNGIAAPRRGLRSSYAQRTVWMCVIIPVVQAPPGTVRGLHLLTASITLKVRRAGMPVPLIPASVLQDILADARLIRTETGQLNEVLYRFHHNGKTINLRRPSQNATAMSVKATGDGGADVILEIHSHGNMKAFWSNTDNRDEKGFRVYGVIGRLDSSAPQIRLRIGIYGYHYPITQDLIFSNTNNSPFIDLEKDAK